MAIINIDDLLAQGIALGDEVAHDALLGSNEALQLMSTIRETAKPIFASPDPLVKERGLESLARAARQGLTAIKNDQARSLLESILAGVLNVGLMLIKPLTSIIKLPM